jgi:hypothetical protein
MHWILGSGMNLAVKIVSSGKNDLQILRIASVGNVLI